MKKIGKFVMGLFSFCLVFGNSNIKNAHTMYEDNSEINKIVIDDSAFSNDIKSDLLRSKFDSYNLAQNDKEVKILASNSTSLEKTESFYNMSFTSGESVITNYDLNYNFETDLITVNLSYYSDGQNIITESFDGYPIYFEDGTFDALFNIDGKKVYLSDLEKNKVENCFALAILGLGSLFAAIASALITAAKVAVVICAVVAIGYVTYQVASLTKAKIKERERAAEKEIKYSNPYVYYPATRKDGQLLIASSPVGLIYASNNIRTCDFWTPFDFLAKTLVIRASGGFWGPHVDSNKNGYYYHYHLKNKPYYGPGVPGGHAFYGYPVNNVYKK